MVYKVGYYGYSSFVTGYGRRGFIVVFFYPFGDSSSFFSGTSLVALGLDLWNYMSPRLQWASTVSGRRSTYSGGSSWAKHVAHLCGSLGSKCLSSGFGGFQGLSAWVRGPPFSFRRLVDVCVLVMCLLYTLGTVSFV